MAANTGDTVRYIRTDGETVDAEVVSVNDDGTVNLRYPHHLNEEVQATADNVPEGTGQYQYNTGAAEPEPGAEADPPIHEDVAAAATAASDEE